MKGWISILVVGLVLMGLMFGLGESRAYGDDVIRSTVGFSLAEAPWSPEQRVTPPPVLQESSRVNVRATYSGRVFQGRWRGRTVLRAGGVFRVCGPNGCG